jgi:hypothetical protein
MDTQLEIFPWARNTDPKTSKAVGKDKDTLLKWGSQRHKILAVYKDNPQGLIDEEAGEISGLRDIRSCCYWKRCSELRQAGYLEDTGLTKKSKANKDQLISKITEKGLERLSVLKA